MSPTPPRPVPRLLRYIWTAPNTALGLLFAPVGLLRGGRVRLVDGVVEIQGPAVSWMLRRLVPLEGGALAMTLGHVVLARDDKAMERCRAHERVHVRQYERWGPLFVPAYFAASALAWLQGGEAYRGNRFEREAYEAESIALNRGVRLAEGRRR